MSDLKQQLDNSFDGEVILADGFDEAFVGIGWQFNLPIAVYDKNLCIEILKSQGMDEIDALEYFEFNVGGSYVGKQTPIFLEHLEKEVEF